MSTTVTSSTTMSSSSSSGACADVVWSQVFTGPGSQWIADITRDTSGNLFIAGGISGPTDFGGGILAGEQFGTHYIAKRDADGNPLWAKTLGDQATLGAGSLATDASGNVFYAAQSEGTVDFGNGPLQSRGFVGALDPDGGALWSIGFDAPVRALALDADGDIALTGIFYDDFAFPGGPVLPGNGVGQVYVAKLASDGTHVWSQVLPDPSAYSVGVAIDAAGNVTVPWIGLDPDTGVPTAALTQLDAAGEMVWERNFGPSTTVSIATVDANDRIVIAGNFFDTIDVGGGPLLQSPPEPYGGTFLAVFAANGSHVWSKSLANAGRAVVFDSDVDAMGRIHLSGLADVAIDFGGGVLPIGHASDGFVAVLDDDGNHVASTVRGGPGEDGFAFLAVDDAGNTIVTSTYHLDSFDIGCGPLPHVDQEETVLASLALP